MPYWLELVIFTVFSGIALSILAYAVKPLGDAAVLVFVFGGAYLAIIVVRRVFGRKRL